MSKFKIGDIVIHIDNRFNDWYKNKYKFKVIAIDPKLDNFTIKVLQDIYYNDKIWYKKDQIFDIPMSLFIKVNTGKCFLPNWF